MVSEWDGIVLEVVEYRETETCVIRVDEAITQALDDHIVMTQAMSFSPFKKPFEAKILEWERTLGMTSEVLDEWLVFQRAWIYLEPIFGSDDIIEQYVPWAWNPNREPTVVTAPFVTIHGARYGRTVYQNKTRD